MIVKSRKMEVKMEGKMGRGKKEGPGTLAVEILAARGSQGNPPRKQDWPRSAADGRLEKLNVKAFLVKRNAYLPLGSCLPFGSLQGPFRQENCQKKGGFGRPKGSLFSN